MERRRIGWIWRAAFVLTALGLSIMAFRLGVDVTERPGLSQAGILTQFYNALGLFVLGGLDLGVPVGGPAWARGVLWTAFFLSPLITTSAVVEGILRASRPEWIARLGRRNHVVVVGAGKLGLLCLEGLCARQAPRLVVVDVDPHHANADEVRSRFGADFVAGDVRHRSTRGVLNLGRARGVVLVTGNDLVNMEAAWNILDDHPGVPVAVHVADIALTRDVPPLPDGAETFNAHQMAAQHLYEDHLEARFAETQSNDVVVIAGFGRFGQTIMEKLLRTAHDELEKIVIVDHSARARLGLFEQQVRDLPPTVSRVAIDGDLADPETWRRVAEEIGDIEDAPAYVLGTDNDSANLRASMLLRAQNRDSAIYVRCSIESRFTVELGKHRDIQVLAVEREMRDAVAERIGSWFVRRGSKSE